MWTVKHSTFDTLDVSSSIVLVLALQILRKFTCVTRSGPSLLRKCWQIQNLTSQISRKFTHNPRADAPLPREAWRVRKRTAPLARERRNLRSESTVFSRLLFRRVAPFAGQSARHGRILDRVAGSGPPRKPVPKCTVKHVTLAALDLGSPIVLRNPAENGPFPRECTPKLAGPRGVFDPSTQPTI